MRVARLPGTTDVNPYQRRFYEALTGWGHELETTGSLDPDWLREHVDRVDVLHLHWRLFRLADPPGSSAALLEPTAEPTAAAVAWVGDGLDLALRLGYRIVWTLHEPAVLLDGEHLDAPIATELLGRVHAIATHDAQSVSLVRAARPAVPCASLGLASCAGDYPVIERSVARQEFDLAESEVMVLAPGGFGPSKQPGDLLRSFAQVEAPEACLRWVGPGMATDSGAAGLLEQARADPRVVLDLGRHDEVGFATAMAAADVSVSARRLPWSNSSLVTAGGFGVPAIAADLPGNHEHLGDAGWFFDPADPSSLASALRRAVNADDRAERGRRTARHVDRTTFDDMAEAFAALLDRVG